MRRREYYQQVLALFGRANERLWETYEETLFTMRRPVTHGNYWRVKRFVGANPPQAAMNDARVHHDLNRVLSRAVYPDASPLARLEDYTEGSTEFASALLHFNNPAYPIFDDFTVRGLNHLEVPTSFRPTIEEQTVQAYQTYVKAIQELKEEIPFYCVPEKNYYLTRIIQETLWMLGRDAPSPPPPRKAPSRRALPGRPTTT